MGTNETGISYSTHVCHFKVHEDQVENFWEFVVIPIHLYIVNFHVNNILCLRLIVWERPVRCGNYHLQNLRNVWEIKRLYQKTDFRMLFNHDSGLEEMFKNFIIENPNKLIQESHIYLPHYCVSEPESWSTELRVVFDNSKSSTGKLSNYIIISIVCRFRSHTHVFSTEVYKMHRQIKLHDDDCKYKKKKKLVRRLNENSKHIWI